MVFVFCVNRVPNVGCVESEGQVHSLTVLSHFLSGMVLRLWFLFGSLLRLML